MFYFVYSKIVTANCNVCRCEQEFLQRSLKMDMGNHSTNMGMGMGMGAEKTGMSMIEGIMGMGMGMGRGQCKLDRREIDPIIQFPTR